MSDKQDYEKHPKYKRWFESLDPVMACPYCRDVIEFGHTRPVRSCCSEMHVDEFYLDPLTEEVLVYNDEYKEAFEAWLKEPGPEFNTIVMAFYPDKVKKEET